MGKATHAQSNPRTCGTGGVVANQFHSQSYVIELESIKFLSAKCTDNELMDLSFYGRSKAYKGQ